MPKKTKRRHEGFSVIIKTRIPPSLAAAVGKVAERKLTSVSEYVRQSLLAALRVDGVQIGWPRDE